MRLIDAEALHKSIVDRYWMLHRMYEEAQDEQTLKNAVAKLVCLVENAMLVKEAPTIEAAPVGHARWREPWPYHTGAICGKCETHAARKHKYCPNCGAKMDEREEDENANA